jgi:hypothetical protein
MSALSRLLSVRIKLGDSPDAWDNKLRRHSPVGAVIAALYYFAALMQEPDPLMFFDFALSGWKAWVSWGIVGGIFFLGILGSGLIFAKRAAGIIFLIFALVYVGPMLSSLAVALLVLKSWPMFVATFAVSCLSIYGLISVQFRLTELHISQVASERLSWRNGDLFLINAAAIEEPQALTPPGKMRFTVLEISMVLVVVFFGPLLLPLSVTDILVDTGMVAPIMWFVSVALFLASRQPMGDQIVLARAMAYRQNAE